MNDYLDQINVKGVLYTISGGAGSGVTPAEVQEMINQSISGMSGDTQIISGDVIELSQDVQNISGDVIVLSGDVIALETLISGKTDTSAFTAHTSDATIHLTSGDVQAQMSAYTYDKQTIDDKIISGGTFDPTQYYRKIETSGATELSAEFDKYYEKTETSGKTELSNEFALYYKKTETSSKTEIDDALAEKQDKLPIYSGTALGGLALNFSGNTASGNYSNAEGYSNRATNTASHAEGSNTTASGGFAHAEGRNTQATQLAAHAEGTGTQAKGTDSHAEGSYTIANNNSEHANGYYNVSRTGSTDADKTLFSVGNGTSSERHNAFEVRYNGDIYISSGGSDIKLQDVIGQGGITSGDVVDIVSGYTYSKDEIDDNEQVVSEALNDLNDRKVESGDVIDIVSGYTYDKDTIDSKIASGGTFDPTLYYKKSETSSKTEIDDALLLDAYETHQVTNTYKGAFPSLTGTADWNTAIQGGIKGYYAGWSDGDFGYEYRLQVIDENGNTFSGTTGELYWKKFDASVFNPLPDYVDIVYVTEEQYYHSIDGWIYRVKDGYRISYAEFKEYWDGTYISNSDINEVKWFEAFPSGYTKDIIEDVIEPIVANVQEKLTFVNNVKLLTYDGKCIPYVVTDSSISQWDSGSTNCVQTGAVYKYTYSKADIDAKIASGITSGDVVDIVSGYTYSKDEIDGKILDSEGRMLDAIDAAVSADTEDIKQDVAQLQLSAVTDAQYDSTAKTINFYNLTGGSVASIDATDFIKDGMIDSVSISGTDLVITFNTESGHEDIVISLADIFNPDNYYTKTEVYNKVEIDNKFWCGDNQAWSQISGSTEPGVLYLIY